MNEPAVKVTCKLVRGAAELTLEGQIHANDEEEVSRFFGLLTEAIDRGWGTHAGGAAVVSGLAPPQPGRQWRSEKPAKPEDG